MQVLCHWHTTCVKDPRQRQRPRVRDARAFNNLECINMDFPTTGQKLLSFGIGLLACVAGEAQAADGKAVYDKTCVACHASGVANAPKFGDKAAWAPRIATGKDAMLASVIKGKGAMPPKAGTTLDDEDLKAAIDYMVSAAK